MARDFKTAIRQQRNRDPLQDVDETVPGFIADPSTYSQPTPGGTRRARTFSQTIADATRGVDAGMNRFTPQKPDLSSSAYKPDWRGHYNGADVAPVPRIFLDLATQKGAFGLPHAHLGNRDKLKVPLADRPPKFQPPKLNVKPGLGPERRLFEAQPFRGFKPRGG